jgi:hypothetical protein
LKAEQFLPINGTGAREMGASEASHHFLGDPYVGKLFKKS